MGSTSLWKILLWLIRDARGAMGGFGGALISYSQTNVNILRSVIASNSADTFGGALAIIGSQLNISDTLFFMNDVSPGVVEVPFYSYGAAIYSSPDGGSSVSITGSVVNSTFVKNNGIPIYDEDRSTGPTNSLVYYNNRFYETSYPGKVYHDSLTAVQTAEGMNALVVSRSSSSTDKSPQNDNQELASEPNISRMSIAPSAVIPTLAAGDFGTINHFLPGICMERLFCHPRRISSFQ